MHSKKLIKNRDLTVIPSSQIDARTFYNLKNSLAAPQVYHCVRYADFAAIASKSASLTIGDLFLKMLMNIRGVSAEKAIEIQKHFPTLIAMVNAMSRVDAAEGKMLVANCCSKFGRKKIGPALSAKIYDVFRPH
jgi:crossover junction endonuclease MUS81